MADLKALAAASPSREAMRAAGYAPVAKSTALHRAGYNVVFWLRPAAGEASELVEYRPRRTHSQSSLLPRVVVGRYEEQAAVHRALGLGVVGRGEAWEWRHHQCPGLFDGLVA